jgi:hypothetical protein
MYQIINTTMKDLIDITKVDWTTSTKLDQVVVLPEGSLQLRRKEANYKSVRTVQACALNVINDYYDEEAEDGVTEFQFEGETYQIESFELCHPRNEGKVFVTLKTV